MSNFMTVVTSCLQGRRSSSSQSQQRTASQSAASICCPGQHQQHRQRRGEFTDWVMTDCVFQTKILKVFFSGTRSSTDRLFYDIITCQTKFASKWVQNTTTRTFSFFPFSLSSLTSQYVFSDQTDSLRGTVPQRTFKGFYFLFALPRGTLKWRKPAVGIATLVLCDITVRTFVRVLFRF